jgi:hypothetical protein
MWSKVVVLELLLVIIVGVYSNWYLTGENVNKNTHELFGGSRNEMSTLYESVNARDNFLLFGGVLAVYKDRSTVSESIVSASVSKIMQQIRERKECSSLKARDVNLTVYELFVSDDYTNVFQFEIGMYDHSTNKFIEKNMRNVSIGLQLSSSVPCCDVTETQPAETQPGASICYRHNISLSFRGKLGLNFVL